MDSKPEVSSLAVRDGKLYAGAQLWEFDSDPWGVPSTGSGALVEIDCADGSVTNTWEVGFNVRLFPDPRNNNGLLLLDGTLYAQDGGISVFDTSTGGPPLRLQDEQDLYGGIEAFACPVPPNGIFTEEVSDFAGQYVKDADREIIRYLKEAGALYRQDTIQHSYPFCCRSDMGRIRNPRGHSTRTVTPACSSRPIQYSRVGRWWW